MLLLFYNITLSQSYKDSLQTQLKSATDENKIEILLELSIETASDSMPEALNYGKQALQLANNIKNDSLIAKSYNIIGHCYSTEHDSTHAIEYFNKAISIAKDISNKKLLVLALFNKANLLNNQGYYLEAMSDFTKALEIAEKNKYYELLSKIYNEIGIIYYNQQKYDSTLFYFKKSLAIDKQNDDKIQIAKSYNNIGVIYKNIGKYDIAIQNQLKALKIREEINDSNGIAMSYNNIGQVYYYWDKNDKCIEYFKKALIIQTELKNKKEIAGLNNNIGSVYTEMKNYHKAIEYYIKALKYTRYNNLRQTTAVLLGNIGLAYAGLKEFNQSLKYHFKSLSLCKQIGHKKSEVYSLNNIGNTYKEMKQYNKALEYYQKTVEISKELNLQQNLLDNYKASYEIYKEINNFKKAFDYHILYTELKDSIFTQQSNEHIIEIQTKYETDKKKKEIEILNKEKELHKVKIARQNIIIYAVIAVLVLLSILASLIYNRYRYKQKANKLLTRQNNEIKSQRDKIAVQQKNITDSIQYASRIQNALLPEDVYLKEVIPEHFILNKPKDIVSGDFYWLKQIKNKLIIAVADCTGHGVPGAFMSMLGVSFLNEIVKDKNIISASKALNRLNESVKKALHQTGKEDEARDGMDIALCVINKDTLELEFSGAYNPVYIVRNKELIQLKGDKRPIGIHLKRDIVFTDKQLQLQKGDLIYIFSDGYCDQIGGAKNTKFKPGPFRELLVSIQDKTMNEQKEILDKTIEKWKGDYEQIDDILIMGIKI